MNISSFNPLIFLASLGAGGIAVAGFIFIQYGGIFTGTGLATFAQVTQTPLVYFLEAMMLIFGAVHLVLTARYFRRYFKWRSTDALNAYASNPLVHSGLMTPIISVAMSFNIIIAVFRYFIPMLSDNFQAMMAPAFVGYVLLWLWAVGTSLSLLKRAFTAAFDVDKIHFGWLLQPFTLAMVTVTGTGFAALAHNTATITYNSDIAGMAAFLATISGSMALFLFSVKLFSIFKEHMRRDNTLEHTFMPTYLIVVPIITLFGISVFRLGHYLNHVYEAPILFVIAKLLLFFFFAFQVWYFAFGLMMLKDYWKGYLRSTFHVSQWGLICPFVGFVALGLFFSKVFFPSAQLFILLLGVYIFTALLFIYLLKRQNACATGSATGFTCE